MGQRKDFWFELEIADDGSSIPAEKLERERLSLLQTVHLPELREIGLAWGCRSPNALWRLLAEI